MQRIAHRQGEGRGGDFEHIAFLRCDAIAERQRRRAEEMDMDVAGTAEQVIFEMMMFQIGEAVRHIAFARQERLFPDRDAIAQDAAGTLDMRRRGADQQFRAKRGLPQL